MKPVYQTIFKPPRGNCLQAAIASIFEMDFESVPNFVEEKDWRGAQNDFLLQYGLYALTVPETDAWRPIGYHLIAGPSPRGDYWHSVVGKDGKPVHDPYPGGGCELGDGETWEWTVFVSSMTWPERNRWPELPDNQVLEDIESFRRLLTGDEA